MPRRAPIPPQARPTRLLFDGREWPMYLESAGWRLRSKAAGRLADHRTGTKNLKEALRRAREYLKRRADDPLHSRRGGGTLEALAAVYLSIPKRTKGNVAENNVSRLRAICRLAVDKELTEVTCREPGPEFWQKYQRAALKRAGHPFDLVTRYRENIAINAAVRAARCLFLRQLLPHYRAAGLEVRPDAGEAVMLPVPYVPQVEVGDAALVSAWRLLDTIGDRQMWITIGLARFAGLRREEISACRGGWIEERAGVVSIALRDRPEEQWWTKTGKPYRAQVIEPTLAAWLREAATRPGPVVPDPSDGSARDRWFAREPQRWLREHGVQAAKPLHRLRGLYADHVAALTADAVTARLAGVKAAQDALGHTTSATTEGHYLTPPP